MIEYRTVEVSDADEPLQFAVFRNVEGGRFGWEYVDSFHSSEAAQRFSFEMIEMEEGYAI
jgi:hypothetical protein